MAYGWYSWRPYVPVAVRRANAAREISRLKRKGERVAPVVIEGRLIARSFWGKAWCDNLESYSDFANRLPRGRTYVRNGSVMDLQLAAGTVTALVSGSELYRVSVAIKPLPRPRWQATVKACAGRIDSLVELLRGKFSRGVMEVLIRPRTGLFPSPNEISFDCSCPDWAGLCKHVAATLYGVGARLDGEPALFFRLRQVDQMELLTAAGRGEALARSAGGKRKRIAESALADVFGIEMDERATATVTPSAADLVKKRNPSRSAGNIPVRPVTRREPETALPPRGRRAASLRRADLPSRRRVTERSDRRVAGAARRARRRAAAPDRGASS